jgi:hypothetical protein
VSCDLYGDKGHGYQECLLAQPDERAQQVNSVNNDPPFMTNPPYKLYPKDSPEFQKMGSGSTRFGKLWQQQPEFVSE